MSYECKCGPQRPIGKNEAVALRIGRLVDDKSDKYGDSVSSSERIMAIWFAKGIPVERLGDAGLMLRCLDKLARLATAPDAYGESPWADLAGYAIRGQEMWERKRSEREAVTKLDGLFSEPMEAHGKHLWEKWGREPKRADEPAEPVILPAFDERAAPMDFSYRRSDVHTFETLVESEPTITRNETPKTEWCRITVTPAPRFMGPNNEMVCSCETCTEVFSRCSNG